MSLSCPLVLTLYSLVNKERECMKQLALGFLMIVAVLLVLSAVFVRWWRERTIVSATPVPIATVMPTTTSEVQALTRRLQPLGVPESVITLRTMDNSDTVGAIRFGQKNDMVVFTVVASMGSTDKLHVWMTSVAGDLDLGELRTGKDGLFFDGQISTSQLPVTIVVAKTDRGVNQIGTRVLEGELKL